MGLRSRRPVSSIEFGGRPDPSLDLRLGDLPQLEAECQIVANAHVRVERVALEDHRDVAVLGRDVVDDPIADPQEAVGDVLEAGDHAQAGGLAAARGPDQDHELAVGDLDVEVVDGDDLPVPLRDVLEGDGRHAACLRGRPVHRGPMHPTDEADSDGPVRGQTARPAILASGSGGLRTGGGRGGVRPVARRLTGRGIPSQR